MPAFLVVQVEVTNPEIFENYRRLVPAALEKYGGRFRVRGGKVETLEGNWTPKRLVIIEFPTVEQAKAWWDSPEYAEAKALRNASANTQMIVAEGV